MTRKTRNADPNPARWQTINQLAELWQVHPRTVRRMIKKKKITVIRIGRSIRIHPDVAEQGPDDTI